MQNLSDFQTIIGYKFQDESLLKQALTHSSFANEKKMKKLSDNERLEFLGDAVLEVVSSEFLFLNYPNLPEGELTKLRASLVCEPTLAFCANEIMLGDYLSLGKGEDMNGGRERKSILSDALEAVIGAIFLDGGMQEAKSFVLKYILTDIEHKKLFHDSKTALQEIVQRKPNHSLEYRLVGQSGPDHARTFIMEAVVNGEVVSRGTGASKKAAEQEAAYLAILSYDKKED